MLDQINNRMIRLSAEEAVLVALCYADIFNFPLKEAELVTYLPFKRLSPKSLKHTVNRLLDSGRVCIHESFLYLPNRFAIVERRLQKAALVEEKWRLLKTYLPPLLAPEWIKAALLTGSLAAGNPTVDADIDLLLILDDRRMWIAYLIVRLWYGKQKKVEFCPNYVISDRQLKMLSSNLFTAIEFNMTIPLKGGPVLERWAKSNESLKPFAPNGLSLEEKRVDLPIKANLMGRFLTALVKSPLGWLLNKCEFARLQWRTKGRYLPIEGVYKPHPPTRQYLIFRKLVVRLDNHGIVATQVRAHVAEQLHQLREQIQEWGINPEDVERGLPKPSKTLLENSEKFPVAPI